jgi:hypothetical protein
MSEAAIPAPAAPSTIPVASTQDLATYREARGKGLTEIPNPAAKPAEAAVAVDDDDPDVKADPELASAIDEIEKPTPEETPAEKAARTRRHKQAAIKQRITKLARARDGEKTRADAAEAELAEWRNGKRTHSGGTPAALPTPAAKSGDTADDPEPKLADFPLDKFKDAEDPYQAQAIALAQAHGRWGARQEIKKSDTAARESRQREQADQEERTASEAFNQRAEDAKKRLSDYDAVVAYELPSDHPVSPDLFRLVTRSDVGPDVAYHLGKNRDVLARLMASRTGKELLIAFGEVQAEVKAALKAAEKVEAPPQRKVTAAQEPLQPVTAGAGTGIQTRRDLKEINSVDEYRAQKARA